MLIRLYTDIDIIFSVQAKFLLMRDKFKHRFRYLADAAPSGNDSQKKSLRLKYDKQKIFDEQTGLSDLRCISSYFVKC